MMRQSQRDAPKWVLIFAAVGEASTGLALLIVPGLVGRLLLGEELTGIAIPVARVAGIALVGLGIACWPGTPRAGMLTYSAAVTRVSRLPRFHGRFDRPAAVAGGRPARDPDGAIESGINERRKDKYLGKQGAATDSKRSIFRTASLVPVKPGDGSPIRLAAVRVSFASDCSSISLPPRTPPAPRHRRPARRPRSRRP